MENQIIWNLASLWIIFNILGLIAYFLWAWWLYMINKKLWNKYPWLAFIPLIQLFSYKYAAGLSWKKLLGWFFWTLIWLLILSILVWFIFGITNASISIWWNSMLNDINTNSHIWNWEIRSGVFDMIINLISYIISLLAIILPYLIIKYLISSGISKNTWRGGWSTFGLFFIPFIMLPVIWYKLKWTEENKKVEL